MSEPSILDGIRVASPCPASWDEMKGDDRARACAACGKDVYNISALTTSEALNLVTAREGTLCVRFFRRGDGTVMTADCPVGAAPALRRRRRLRRVAGLGAVGLAFLAMGASAAGLRGRDLSGPPWGPGVTMDDWVDWALVTIGVRQPQLPVIGLILMPRVPGGSPESADEL